MLFLVRALAVTIFLGACTATPATRPTNAEVFGRTVEPGFAAYCRAHVGVGDCP